VTRYLLDTNVVSEVRKLRPHPAVIAWLSGQHAEQLLIAAVTAAELQAGLERTRRQDQDKAAELELWIDRLISAYQFLPMDAACFREWARLMDRKPRQLEFDAMIAATARVHDLTVATRNEQDFKHFDVQLFNPFKP